MPVLKDIQYLTLDFSGVTSNQSISVKQGDVKSRFIEITPILNNQALILSADEKVEFRCIKPDKKSVSYPVECTDGKINVELDEQVLVVSGVATADVVILGVDGEILSSAKFCIHIISAASNGKYLPSEDYFKRKSKIDMNGYSIQNLPEPTENGDAVNKVYVDEKVKNINIEVDDEFDEDSTNPVENQVAAKAYNTLYTRLSAIDGHREAVTPQWESGSFNASATYPPSIVNNANRIHTPKDKPIPLKKGDKFELPKIPDVIDYQYSLYWFSTDGAYHYVSQTAYKEPYEITEDGDYFISLRRVDGTLVASADDVIWTFVQGENKVNILEKSVEELDKKVETEVDTLKERMSALDGKIEENPIEWVLGEKYYQSGNSVLTTKEAPSSRAEIVLNIGDEIINKDYNKGQVIAFYDIDGTIQKVVVSTSFYATIDGTYYITVKPTSGNDANLEEINSIFELSRGNVGDGIISNLEKSYATYHVPEYVKGVYLAKHKDFDETSATRLQDVYDWYDELMFAHNSSMSKEQYGTTQIPEGVCAEADPNTYPMYSYTIAPLKFAKHKIILAYGIHGNGSGGDAIQGVIGLAYFVKDLLNNYLKNPTMKYIREWCTVVVMPVLNPWGYQNNSRGNGRNIDLNRNFEVGFIANQTSPSADAPATFNGNNIVSGTSAFSETESVAIRDYISQNHTDASFMLEGHSRGKTDKLLNRFQTYVADVDMSTEQANAINKSSKRLVEKYGGNYVGTTSSEAKGQCFRYFRDTFDIFAYENEAFGRYVLPTDNTNDKKNATMEKTDGTDLTQIQATDFVASTILAVAESLGLTSNEGGDT